MTAVRVALCLYAAGSVLFLAGSLLMLWVEFRKP